MYSRVDMVQLSKKWTDAEVAEQGFHWWRSSRAETASKTVLCTAQLRSVFLDGTFAAVITAATENVLNVVLSKLQYNTIQRLVSEGKLKRATRHRQT